MISAENVRPIIVTANFLWIEPAEKEADKAAALEQERDNLHTDYCFAGLLPSRKWAKGPEIYRNKSCDTLYI